MIRPFDDAGAGRIRLREGGGVLAVLGIPFLCAGIFVTLSAAGVVEMQRPPDASAALWPLLTLFGLAFTAYDGLTAPTWTGLTNFRELLHDPLFRIAAWNSLSFVALTVPLRMVIALA